MHSWIPTLQRSQKFGRWLSLAWVALSTFLVVGGLPGCLESKPLKVGALKAPSAQDKQVEQVPQVKIPPAPQLPWPLDSKADQLPVILSQISYPNQIIERQQALQIDLPGVTYVVTTLSFCELQQRWSLLESRVPCRLKEYIQIKAINSLGDQHLQQYFLIEQEVLAVRDQSFNWWIQANHQPGGLLELRDTQLQSIDRQAGEATFANASVVPIEVASLPDGFWSDTVLQMQETRTQATQRCLAHAQWSDFATLPIVQNGIFVDLMNLPFIDDLFKSYQLTLEFELSYSEDGTQNFVTQLIQAQIMPARDTSTKRLSPQLRYQQLNYEQFNLYCDMAYGTLAGSYLYSDQGEQRYLPNYDPKQDVMLSALLDSFLPRSWTDRAVPLYRAQSQEFDFLAR